MSPVVRRFPQILLASTVAIAAFASAPALADPTPAAPAPVAMPYPNTTTTDPGATPDGGKTPTHKHIAGVKYEDRASGSAASTAAGDAQMIETEAISWGVASDPEEGGQIAARRFTPGKPTYGDVTFNSSPPVAADAKTHVSEIPVTKLKDVASSKLSAAPESSGEPGKLEYPNAGIAAKTTATFGTLAGKCVKGKHLDKVIITTRSGGSYTLHDAIVTDVTPAGDGMETVTLSYASRDE